MTNQSDLLLALCIAVGVGGMACDKSSGESSGGASAGPSASASATTTPSAAPSASASAASDTPGEDAAAAQADEDEHVADELQSHHRHHHQGLAGFVIMAVETLGIAPDQQTAVDAIRKDYRVKMKPLHEANAAVLQLLADGIAAGTIDKAKVDAGVAKAGTASAAVQTATPDLLNRLHDALRPEQRSALVDKIDAHWSVWRDVNSGGQDGGAESAKGDRRIAHLAKEVGLTSDQLDKFQTNLDAAKDPKKSFDPATVETYVKAFDTAFVADKFDAKTLPAASSESSRIVSFGAERMARIYEALAPVLTPDQRPKVADLLRQRAEPKEKP